MVSTHVGAEYLADGELRVIGFSHGVINKGCHHLSDLVQIIGPSFLMDEKAPKIRYQTVMVHFKHFFLVPELCDVSERGNP